MATNTYGTYLMHGTVSGNTTTYGKLVDITEFPDIGQDPDMLETTTLSDKMRTYILGIMGNDGMNFKSNYDMTAYQALKALEGKTEKYGIWFGHTAAGVPDGSLGKFNFDGQLTAHPTGGGVNEVRGMSISIAPSSVITEEFPS